jgi:hypothetical protein
LQCRPYTALNQPFDGGKAMSVTASPAANLKQLKITTTACCCAGFRLPHLILEQCRNTIAVAAFALVLFAVIVIVIVTSTTYHQTARYHQASKNGSTQEDGIGVHDLGVGHTDDEELSGAASHASGPDELSSLPTTDAGGDQLLAEPGDDVPEPSNKNSYSVQDHADYR